MKYMNKIINIITIILLANALFLNYKLSWINESHSKTEQILKDAKVMHDELKRFETFNREICIEAFKFKVSER